MEKLVDKIMKKTKKTVIEEHYYICDDCNTTYDPPIHRWYTCCMCGKDVCKICVVYDDRDDGDYPAVYCKSCWRIGEPFRAEQAKLESQYCDAIDRFDRDWIKACGLG